LGRHHKDEERAWKVMIEQWLVNPSGKLLLWKKRVKPAAIENVRTIKAGAIWLGNGSP